MYYSFSEIHRHLNCLHPISLGEGENSETSEKYFPMFPFSSFRLPHRVYSKTRKIIFRGFRVFELPFLTELSHDWVNE